MASTHTCTTWCAVEKRHWLARRGRQACGYGAPGHCAAAAAFLFAPLPLPLLLSLARPIGWWQTVRLPRLRPRPSKATAAGPTCRAPPPHRAWAACERAWEEGRGRVTAVARLPSPLRHRLPVPPSPKLKSASASEARPDAAAAPLPSSCMEDGCASQWLCLDRLRGWPWPGMQPCLQSLHGTVTVFVT